MKPSINSQWPTINPGEFRHQINLLVQVVGSDESGTNVTYSPPSQAVNTWVKIDYVRGDELIKSGQDVTQVVIKCTGWYRSEFTAQSRIQLPSGQQFIIQYIENVREQNMYMVLTCIGIGTADQ